MNCHLNEIEIVYKYQTFIFFIVYFLISFSRPHSLCSVLFFSVCFGTCICMAKMVSVVSPSFSLPFHSRTNSQQKKSEQGKNDLCSDKYGGLLSFSLSACFTLHTVTQTFTHFRGWIECDNKSTGSQCYYAATYTHFVSGTHLQNPPIPH